MSSTFSGGRRPGRHQRRLLDDAATFAGDGRAPASPIDHRATVAFDGVNATVDGRRVLTLVDLEISRGTLTVVTGLTGLAKRAFVELLLGRRRPDDGTLHVVGRQVRSGPEDLLDGDRPLVGIVPRTAGLLSSRTVRENVAILLANGAGLPDAEIDARVGAQLEALDLVDVADELPDELSLGRRKLVAFARARVMEPDVIVLDEPEAGLDRPRGILMFDLIEQLKAEDPGRTFVVISQDLPLGCRIAERLVLFSHGHPVAHGTVDELAVSRNPHVRALVGEARADR